MSLDTKIPGNPASIHALADWLGHLNAAVKDADIQMTWVASNLGSYWQGSAAAAFYEAVQALRRSQFPVSDYLDDAVGVFRAYANRLTRGRDYFDEILRSAQDIGLTVDGLVIERPTTRLTYCPNPNAPYAPPPGPAPSYLTPINGYRPDPSVSPEVNEYNGYLYRLTAYNDACSKVGTWEGELDQWLADHMAQLVGRVDEMAGVAEIFGALRAGSEAVVRGALKGAEERYVVDMAGWRQVQAEFSDLATEARRAAHSGNPARRAAFEAFDFSANAAKIGGLEVEIGKVAKYSNIIPIAGTVIDLSLAGYDIAHGESESSVLAGLGGGAAAGGVAAAVVSGPVVWVAGVVALAGVAGGYAGKWLWEATVDLDTRESIDCWLEENVEWDPTSGKLKTG